MKSREHQAKRAIREQSEGGVSQRTEFNQGTEFNQRMESENGVNSRNGVNVE